MDTVWCYTKIHLVGSYNFGALGRLELLLCCRYFHVHFGPDWFYSLSGSRIITMVMVENGHGASSSNPGRNGECFTFTLMPLKKHKSICFLLSYN